MLARWVVVDVDVVSGLRLIVPVRFIGSIDRMDILLYQGVLLISISDSVMCATTLFRC